MGTDGIERIAWHGDVDLRNINEVRAQITVAVATEGLQKLVIDLSDTEFIDSLGVGALIGAREQCSEVGAQLALADVPDRTLQLLRAAGLDQIFTIERSDG